MHYKKIDATKLCVRYNNTWCNIIALYPETQLVDIEFKDEKINLSLGEVEVVLMQDHKDIQEEYEFHIMSPNERANRDKK